MDKQDWKNLLYGFLAICIYFGIEFGIVAWRDAKLERERVDKIKKPRYKAMNVIKYSNDTIEFFSNMIGAAGTKVIPISLNAFIVKIFTGIRVRTNFCCMMLEEILCV